MKNQIIILNKKNDHEMKAWEKIFFMLLDSKKSYGTLTDIAEATTKKYKLKRPMSQGTVSKCLYILQGTIAYDGKSYTVRKMIKQNLDGRDTEELCYKLVTETEIDRLWNEGKDKLDEGKYLVEGKLCAVSKHMYIFKLKKKTRKKEKLDESQQDGIESNTQTSKGTIKKVKQIFESMVLPEFLYDVSYFDGNIVVMLNSQNSKSKTKYSKYFEDFWTNP